MKETSSMRAGLFLMRLQTGARHVGRSCEDSRANGSEVNCRTSCRRLGSEAVVSEGKPHLRPSWCQRPKAVRTSFSPAVPLPCQLQESRPVFVGHPRTTPQRLRPAPLASSAGSDPARSGFASRWSIGRRHGLACRARPARSRLGRGGPERGGVCDQTGPARLTYVIPWCARPCRRSRWPSRGTRPGVGYNSLGYIPISSHD